MIEETTVYEPPTLVELGDFADVTHAAVLGIWIDTPSINGQWTP
ncbi:lasso RiPP family leader peptide-containing protein [Amycolatopsis antarctica]|nr:lasso RiPP family leader peptide-containing protein [Amycolatopsis antarctica]